MKDMKLYYNMVCAGCGCPVSWHRDKCGRSVSCEILTRRHLPVPTVVKAPPGKIIPDYLSNRAKARKGPKAPRKPWRKRAKT